MTDSTDLAALDATAQAELVRRGEVSPLDLVDAAIERIERRNPEINAVILPRFEQARAEAAAAASGPDAPFRGVPMVLKDLDGVSAGDPYHAGTRGLRARGHVADHDSHLVTRFREAGFIVVGRANTPELGLVPTTEPLSYGPARNPWNTAHSTGGSSGGPAAAVASGMVPIGHAGDGGGSIRIPASECGLVGFKPSRARHSLGPEAGEAWGGLVARLAVTRTVRDTAAVLDAVQGTMPGDPYTAPPPSRPYLDEVGADPGHLRIGFTLACPDPAVAVHPECVAAVEGAVRLLTAEGHRVEEAQPAPWADPSTMAELTTHFINCYAAWTLADVEHLAAATGGPFGPDDLEPNTWALVEMGKGVTALQYLQAQSMMNDYCRSMAAFWADGYDLLLSATIPEPPPTLGQFDATDDNPMVGLFRSAAVVPYTIPFNITGQPAISLPLHWSADGLPIGVQLVAAYGREDLLIRVAAQLETVAPWADRRPPHWA